MRQRMRACAALALATVLAREARAVEGARAYPLSPVGLDVVIALAIVGEGDAPSRLGQVARTDGLELVFGSLEYERTCALAGRLVTAFAIQPFGRIDDGDYRLGDAVLGAVVGLVGSPALTGADYGGYDPGLSLGLLGKVALPTGDYDRHDRVNVGGNRWWFEIGLPAVEYVGASLTDPHLLTIELMPSITWFGDNRAPPGGGTLEQSPLLQLEGHVTANVTRKVWVSADAQGIAGGETTTDGIHHDDAQRAVALGFTIDTTLGPRSALKFGFEQTADRNASGPAIRDWFVLFGTLL